MKRVLPVVSLLLLAGCGGFTAKQSTIVEVGEPSQVKGCQFLQTFKGPAGYTMWGPPAVIGDFKNQAIRKAEALGATHILWRTDNTGLDQTTFVDAYKCPVVEEDNSGTSEDSKDPRELL